MGIHRSMNHRLRFVRRETSYTVDLETETSQTLCEYGRSSHFCFTENGRKFFPAKGFRKQSIEFSFGGPQNRSLVMSRYNKRGVLTNKILGLQNIRRALPVFIVMDEPQSPQSPDSITMH